MSYKILFPVLIYLFLSRPSFATPEISFFVEMPGDNIEQLFDDSSLVSQLVKMKASLRIGILDFSTERTRVIQKLNKAGIPVTAWLLLPQDEGYWFNAGNADQASSRYDNFREWTRRNNLKWAGIGIDLEPDMNDIKQMMVHPWKIAWKVYKRLYTGSQLEEAQKKYNDLIGRMHADGYTVESYLIYWMYDEREAGTHSLCRLMGVNDLKNTREIPMTYTSLTRDPAIIPVYFHEGMPLGLGSTGGGVDIGGQVAPVLSWDELHRDILIASQYTHEIVIFSLEGSVEKGWLPKIASIDFSEQPPDISAKITAYNKTQKYIRFVLKSLDHPFLSPLVLLLLITGILYAVIRLVIYLLKSIF